MLGINNAIKLINKINFADIYDNRCKETKTICEIENFNYEEFLNYLSNLSIPYSVLEKFFEGYITFADLNNKPYNDEWDYLVIDSNGDIYCWTEVAGNIYYLKDYDVKWKEYVEPPLSEEDKLKEERKRKENEKLFSEHLEKIFNEVLPKFVADKNVADY